MINTVLIRFAKFYASVKHAGQTYSNGLPYTHHLAAVEEVLRRFGEGLNDTLLAAAWLHDVVEDTGVKLKEIQEMFGLDVALLVDAVTNEKGENRKIRHALTYPKTRRAGATSVRLKLADRIANVEAGGNLVGMYRKEYEDFSRALYTSGQNEDMWAHLDGLMEEPKNVELKTAQTPCFCTLGSMYGHQVSDHRDPENTNSTAPALYRPAEARAEWHRWHCQYWHNAARCDCDYRGGS